MTEYLAALSRANYKAGVYFCLATAIYVWRIRGLNSMIMLQWGDSRVSIDNRYEQLRKQ